MIEVFSYKPLKQPKVNRKKLGKEQVWGTWDVSKNTIEIDERLKGKKELIIFLHEYFHKLFPYFTEEEIIMKSESTADFLWKNHFRKVDLSTK